MKLCFLGVAMLLLVSISVAGVNPIISSGLTNSPRPWPTVRPSLDFLSQDQMAQGLRDALNRGIQSAVIELGRDNGFFTNMDVRIPMPQKLLTAERTLRTLGQDKLADEFIATMNHAAEQAVPQAAAVFVDAVQHMTISDARGILTGPDDAATRYFRSVTETNLHSRFLPIVKSATDRAGVTSTYKRFIGAMNENRYFGPLSSILLNTESVDIDSYITDKALDGLFTMVAKEETQIRRNPVARTNELLQRVFGAIFRGARG